MSRILVLAEAAGDAFPDACFELLGLARELAGPGGVMALAIGPGPDPAGLPAGAVLSARGPGLERYSPEAWLAVLADVATAREADLVLLANTTAGMDLGGALSVAWGRPLVTSVVGLRTEGDDLVATSQLFGGRLVAESVLEGGRGICAVVPGSFPLAAAGAPGSIEAVALPGALAALRTEALEVPAGESEDVDITKAPMLVSVGRGLQSADNVPLATEVAAALGAALAGTSQVCDLGWLPRTRHVGKSGLKVRPRAYLAFGISGAPEHLEGIGASELVVACTTDPQAPFFLAADYGTTVDAVELLRALLDALASRNGPLAREM